MISKIFKVSFFQAPLTGFSQSRLQAMLEVAWILIHREIKKNIIRPLMPPSTEPMSISIPERAASITAVFT